MLVACSAFINRNYENSNALLVGTMLVSAGNVFWSEKELSLEDYLKQLLGFLIAYSAAKSIVQLSLYNNTVRQDNRNRQ